MSVPSGTSVLQVGQVCRMCCEWAKWGKCASSGPRVSNALQVGQMCCKWLYNPESTSPKSPSKSIEFEGDFA